MSNCACICYYKIYVFIWSVSCVQNQVRYYVRKWITYIRFWTAKLIQIRIWGKDWLCFALLTIGILKPNFIKPFYIVHRDLPNSMFSETVTFTVGGLLTRGRQSYHLFFFSIKHPLRSILIEV